MKTIIKTIIFFVLRQVASMAWNYIDTNGDGQISKSEAKKFKQELKHIATKLKR